MISLSSVEAKLPPGFRFHPKDEELIFDYLMKFVSGCNQQAPNFLIQVDLNKCEPWDIPETACVGGKEWYFYSQRDRKYATGLRTNRATVSGYWKATGKDRPITRKGTLIGMRKTLVFYQGRAPKGRKTEWVMHEFRLEENLGPGPKLISPTKEDWVLCRMFYKSRIEVPSKQALANHIDETTSSSSLPPLMEPYNITFDQSHDITNDHHYHDEQVPCFSMYQTSPSNFPLVSIIDPSEFILPEKNMPKFEEIFPDLGIYNPPGLINKSDLIHLTKMESGEGSSDSYLSEVGLSSMWKQFS